MARLSSLLWRVWDAFTIYIPVLLMVLLALGTWWLTRNGPGISLPEAARVVRHTPDYFMTNFAVKNYDAAGALLSEVAGAKGRHFEDTDVLEIDSARIRSVSKEGRETLATASRAITNADGSELQLIGNARVVREAGKDANGQALPRIEFAGEFLHAFGNEEKLKSHKPVTITRGSDTFSADSLAYDNVAQTADLQGRVRGVLAPRTP
jgi:lipopolysaccharide export system protein LptC